VLVGLTDTLGRVLLPLAMGPIVGTQSAATLGSALASMGIYILMALVLLVRPTGLFGRV
jgi:branched-chain amino acid transport system permease protein